MTRVFISYRRDDTGYIASMLAEKLAETFGNDSVFLDVDNIPLGVDFRTHLDSAVAKCDVFLALIGDHWLDVQTSLGTRRLDDPGDFVRIEIESALRRGIPIIPVLSEFAMMPRDTDLPPELSQFAFRNAAELRSGKNLRFHMDALLKGIQGIVPSKRSATRPSPKNEQLPILEAAPETTRKSSPPRPSTHPTTEPTPVARRSRGAPPRNKRSRSWIQRMFLLYWPRSLVCRTLHLLFYGSQILAILFAIVVAVTPPPSSWSVFFFVILPISCAPGYLFFWLPAIRVKDINDDD